MAERTYKHKKELREAGYISGMGVGALISKAIHGKCSGYAPYRFIYDEIFKLIRASCPKIIFGTGHGTKSYYNKEAAERIIAENAPLLLERTGENG